jgi:hypothetical protein
VERDRDVPHRTVFRALREELGVDPGEVVDFALLGFGVDMRCHQFNFIGAVHLGLGAQEITERQARRCPGRQEVKEILAIPCEPETVLARVASEVAGGRRFWSCGWATTYFAMVHWAGHKATDAAMGSALGAK